MDVNGVWTKSWCSFFKIASPMYLKNHKETSFKNIALLNDGHLKINKNKVQTQVLWWLRLKLSNGYLIFLVHFFLNGSLQV